MHCTRYDSEKPFLRIERVETAEVKEIIERCLLQVATRVVGQQDAVRKILLALVSGGHVLVEGVPGIAKTLMVSTVAQLCGLTFKRIQFTPDLLPSDLIGMSIFRPDEGKFVVEKGPVFTNIVLADEINRAPPKVQSALLEVMAEKQVTIFGQTFYVYPPYFVMATQNPIEQEGTYVLPEAQLDRFMLKILLSYPTPEEEKKVVQDCMVQMMPKPISTMLSPENVLALQEKLDDIHVDERVIQYAVDIVSATRTNTSEGKHNEGLILWGASPRATMWLIRGARAIAMFDGRDFVTPHDVKVLAPDVLRHRLILTYKAQADGINSDAIVDRILKEIPSP
jgi:MoxR-like ATPase